MTNSIVKIQDVDLIYTSKNREFLALSQINLAIEKGEFICILGPSGCGKSSLLNLTAGFLQPTKGTVSVNGRIMTQPDWTRGVVFQQAALYPWLSVRQNIEFGPRVRKLPSIEINKISQELLEEIDMVEQADSYPEQLSGGMKQRVAFARALANRPDIVLMDEPFSALDALTRRNMQVFLRKLWQYNHQTCLLITHDIDEALLLATKIYVMGKNPGRLMANYEVDFGSLITEKTLEEIQNMEHFVRLKEKLYRHISIN